jgi:hypothetical protein
MAEAECVLTGHQGQGRQGLRLDAGRGPPELLHCLMNGDAVAFEQSQGATWAAVRQTGCLRAGGWVLHWRLLSQDRVHFAVSQGRQTQDTAARADGREDPLHGVCNEDQHRAGGRLLNQFQQGVGAGGVQLVQRIDDDESPAAFTRGLMQKWAKRADSIGWD